ncbi:phage tail assembly chaperone G [Enterococcus sp. DIV0240a]|uniref:phage tail assembly chaperone G n=1 Tax=unclassified Enterococcus TaxID=2608891 RepID=UPI003D26C4C2
MAKVRLELKNKKGEVIVYENPDTTGRDYRTALETIKKLNSEGTKMWDQLDYYLDFAIGVFEKHKLTSDQILDGLPSESVITALDEVLSQVVGIESNPDPDAKK